jgi:hypothetical protein
MLHERENSEETESFLKENGKKFSQDCITALKLMYSGIKLNGNTCKQLYGFHDRRLRELRDAKPGIVKSAWAKNSEGRRLYVEFWIEQPMSKTKAAAIAMGEKILQQMKDRGFNQGELF